MRRSQEGIKNPDGSSAGVLDISLGDEDAPFPCEYDSPRARAAMKSAPPFGGTDPPPEVQWVSHGRLHRWRWSREQSPIRQASPVGACRASVREFWASCECEFGLRPLKSASQYAKFRTCRRSVLARGARIGVFKPRTARRHCASVGSQCRDATPPRSNLMQTLVEQIEHSGPAAGAANRVVAGWARGCGTVPHREGVIFASRKGRVRIGRGQHNDAGI